MNRILYLFIILVLFTSCSFNKNSKFWTNSKEVQNETRDDYEEVFPAENTLKKEFNSKLKIKLTSKPINNQSVNNHLNNLGRLNYDGDLKKSSRYKFSKIENFSQYQPEISFYKNSVIFFDNKGSILKFDEQSKLIWKKN